MQTSGYDPSHEHVAAFYRTDGFLVERVSAFIGEGLRAGEHVIVLATLPHWNAIAARLEAAGIGYGRATSEGRLILIDAEHLLETITVEGGIPKQQPRETFNDSRVDIVGEQSPE